MYTPRFYTTQHRHMRHDKHLNVIITGNRFHDDEARARLGTGERRQQDFTCDSYSRSLRLATSLLMMVPMYSMTMVHFSMSLAA